MAFRSRYRRGNFRRNFKRLSRSRRRRGFSSRKRFYNVARGGIRL